VVVRRRGTAEAKLTAAKKRALVALVGEGSSIAGAAEAVGVSPRTVARMRREDSEFSVALDDAREGLGYELEAVAHIQATRGYERPLMFQGVQRGVEYVPVPRLMERMLEANLPGRYRRDTQAPTVVVIAPMSAAELQAVRTLGREQSQAIEVLAAEMADAEREREVKQITAGSS